MLNDVKWENEDYEFIILLISLFFIIAEIKVLQSNMTLEEIDNKEAKLSNEVGLLKNLIHL